MQNQILFAHSGGPQGGPGKGSYDLVAYLKSALGEKYNIFDPLIEDPEAPTYEIWKTMLKEQFTALTHPVILISHSLGGSILLKYLIVPFRHLSFYKKHFKDAIFRELEVSDHAFAKGLPQLVNDTKSLGSDLNPAVDAPLPNNTD